jgi:hypothetical protein
MEIIISFGFLGAAIYFAFTERWMLFLIAIILAGMMFVK